MTYTILPPGPVDPTLKFDRHQFVKRSKAISTESHISFSDYEHMHMESHRGHRRLCEFGPVFANNENQLRHVIATAVWQACRGSRLPLPEGLENNWRELVRMSAEKVLKMRNGETHQGWQRNILGRYLWNAEKAGGYLHFQVRLLYLSWHLGYTSVEVAQELGTTPQNVRIVLYRLCQTARRLGYETFQRRNGVKPLEPRRPSPLTKLPPGPQLVEIYDVFSPTFREIATRFGVSTYTVCNAYTRAKKLADPNYEPPRKGPRRWVKLERSATRIIGRSTRGPK